MLRGVHSERHNWLADGGQRGEAELRKSIVVIADKGNVLRNRTSETVEQVKNPHGKLVVEAHKRRDGIVDLRVEQLFQQIGQVVVGASACGQNVAGRQEDAKFFAGGFNCLIPLQMILHV